MGGPRRHRAAPRRGHRRRHDLPLHAYRNPAHERALAEICGRLLPGVPVPCSSEVVPEITECEGTSTTYVNVCVVPLISPYLDDLERKLQDHGIPGHLHIMLSAERRA